MSRPARPAHERFWAKVDKTETCWNWTAYRDKDGYGRFSPRAGEMAGAHRFVFELAGVAIPAGMVVDHRCHNTSCVRLGHLRVVSQKQNCENRAGAQHDNKSSGVRGVSWSAKAKKWMAHVRHNGVLIRLGSFMDLHEAESAVIAKRNELFTHNDADRETAA